MLLCANNGEYKSYILESPLGKPINTVYSFSNGFVVCERNNFLIFQSEDGDERALLRQDGPPIPILMNDNSSSSQLGSQPPSIISLVANEDESEIYAITSHGQMITAKIDLTNNEEGSGNFDEKFDNVLGPFHRAEITGLDVCIRKELIATCSRDKSVNIWNYVSKTHELGATFTEECLTLAFHPSGLHLIVALQDKVQMCNVLSN